MSKALFSYDAWNSVTFAAEEVKDPERNLPRALILGHPRRSRSVYCSAVAVYLYVVPIGEMAAVTENRIATEAAVRMIGPAGGAFIAVAILVSTFGCVNGLTLAGRAGRLRHGAGRPLLPRRGVACIPATAPRRRRSCSTASWPAF